MSAEIWTYPRNSEVIKTHEIHCQACGARYRIILPPGIVTFEEEMNHYKKMAEHCRLRMMALERLLKLVPVDFVY